MFSILFYFVFIPSYFSIPALGAVNVSIPWQQFLEQHDPRWTWGVANGEWSNLPTSWEQGGFIGNGRIGSLILNDIKTKNLNWVVAHTDVWDHRQPGASYSLNDFSYDKTRLPVGTLHVTTLGDPLAGEMTLHLYNATQSGEFNTTLGTVSWSSFAHTSNDVVIIDFVSSTTEEVGVWFEAFPAVTPRNFSRPNPKYVPNPPATSSQISGVNVSLQPLLAGGGYVTAWKLVPISTTKQTLYLSIAFDKETLAAAQKIALNAVLDAISVGVAELLVDHVAWWNLYYQRSFISVPNTKMEGFYYIQMYKLASGMRGNTQPLDMLGPWMNTQTPWPDLHWDLNVQLTFWPLYASNHLDIAQSLPTLIYNNINNLLQNVPSAYTDSIALPMASSTDLLTSCYDNHTSSCLVDAQEETGNLMWVCHNLWLHYRYTMDTKFLANILFPILRKAVNFYLHLAYFDLQDSCYHLPVSWSPEYSIHGPDANYDLSLFRWGLLALLDISKNILGINDPLFPTWQKYSDALVDYQSDNKTGYKIAKDIPLNTSHHLYSHLFMIYPLHLVNYAESSNAYIMEQSIDHWYSLDAEFMGHSYTGVGAMNAVIGRADAALGNITFFIDGGCSLKKRVCKLSPNTFYYEENSQWACIESPLSLCSTLHELLLQSWDKGVIHVFPAVSNQWPDVVFHNLLTEGAFLVTGKRVNMSTQFIQITSIAGAPCVIKTNILMPIVVDPPYPYTVIAAAQKGWSIVTLKISKSQTATLFQQGTGTNFSVQPLAGDPAYYHYWGYH